MNAKNLIIEFINMIFMIVLILFCVIYFLAFDRFAAFTQIMESLMPIAVFGILFLIKMKLNRRVLKKRKNEDNLEIVLYLNYFDKFKTDILTYLMPMAIIFVAFIINKNVDSVDILQAIIAFLLFYFWQKILFKKEG